MKFNKELWQAPGKGELMDIRRSLTIFYVAMLCVGRDTIPHMHT